MQDSTFDHKLLLVVLACAAVLALDSAHSVRRSEHQISAALSQIVAARADLLQLPLDLQRNGTPAIERRAVHHRKGALSAERLARSSGCASLSTISLTYVRHTADGQSEC